MKINLKYGLLFFMALFNARVTHAEGSCPPGQYPQQGQGWQTCVPIPGGQAARPAPNAEQWEDRWGAIAKTPEGQISGGADSQRTEGDAINAAIADCLSESGEVCKSMGTYRNQCLAIAAGSDDTRINVGRDANDAIQQALKQCKDSKQQGCHLYYSACSLPVRTR